MQTNEELKALVREKYSQIAERRVEENQGTCCGCGPECGTEFSMIGDEYAGVAGYVAEADLGLGCGLPTEYAHLQPGYTVLDLGSGAGNDCFVARALVGESGRVIGVDFSEAMLAKARRNAAQLGYANVEFVEGDIEHLPLPADSVDVVVSNCVLNLVPNKKQAFAEVLRVLKPGGHFSISDVVVRGELPPPLRAASEMYAGCVAGALPQEQYLGIIRQLGFKALIVQKERPIALPEEILRQYLTEAELTQYRASGSGLYSLTVYAAKAPETGGPDCC